MPARFQELIDALRVHGVISADAPVPTDIEESRPWFLAILQAVAGWLAGICTLGIVGLLFRPQSMGVITTVGLVLLAAAWLLYLAGRRALFLEQFALALSVAGQFALAWVIFETFDRALPTAATLLVVQAVIFLIMPNKMARTLAALFACIAWVLTVRFLLRPGAGEQNFFAADRDGQFPMFGAWSVPIGWIVTWAPLVALAWALVRHESRWMAGKLRVLARPLLAGVLLGISLAAVWTEPFASLAWGVDDIGIRFSPWALFPLFSIALAMFAGFQAYRVSSSGLLGVAIVAALVHLSRFYYLYGTTLIWKSAIMIVVGAALLAAGVMLGRRAQVNA